MDQRHERARAAAAVLLERVAAGEDQGVELAQPTFDRPLSAARPAAAGRPLKQQRTQFGAVAGLAVVFPEQVHRADQPVLVRRHDPHGPAIGPSPRTPGPPTSEML